VPTHLRPGYRVQESDRRSQEALLHGDSTQGFFLDAGYQESPRSLAGIVLQHAYFLRNHGRGAGQQAGFGIYRLQKGFQLHVRNRAGSFDLREGRQVRRYVCRARSHNAALPCDIKVFHRTPSVDRGPAQFPSVRQACEERRENPRPAKLHDRHNQVLYSEQ